MDSVSYRGLIPWHNSPRSPDESGLIIEELPGEVLVYDSDREQRSLCLNHMAAQVWKLCDGKDDARAYGGVSLRKQLAGNRRR